MHTYVHVTECWLLSFFNIAHLLVSSDLRIRTNQIEIEVQMKENRNLSAATNYFCFVAIFMMITSCINIQKKATAIVSVTFVAFFAPMASSTFCFTLFNCYLLIFLFIAEVRIVVALPVNCKCLLHYVMQVGARYWREGGIFYQNNSTNGHSTTSKANNNCIEKYLPVFGIKQQLCNRAQLAVQAASYCFSNTYAYLLTYVICIYANLHTAF